MLSRFQRRLALTLRRRPLLPFLLAATLAVDAVIFASTDNNPPEVLTIPAAFAQLGLLGLWGGQLRRRWKRRCVAAIVGLVAIASLFVLPDGLESRTFTIYFGFGLMVAALTAATQFVRRNLMKRTSGEEPIRFSIAGILAATTVVAILASLLRFVRIPSDPLEMAIICFPMMLLPVLTHSIVRRFRQPSTIVLSVLGATLMCGVVFVALIGGLGDEDGIPWFVAVVGQGVFYLLWLFGLRVRLHKLTQKESPKQRLRVVRSEADPISVEPKAPPVPIDLEA